MKKFKKIHIIFFLLIGMIVSVSSPVGAAEASPLSAENLQSELFTVTPEKSLLITDLSVIEDPSRTYNFCNDTGTKMGTWTFGHLMTEMANQEETGIHPGQFAKNWLRTWARDQTVNGQTVPFRGNVLAQIFRPWQNASGDFRDPLDMSIAPFRLMAIVNRVDLNDDHDFAGVGAGEARFVFVAMDVENNCRPLDFTVIFEYQIPGNTCSDIQNWAKEWQTLEEFALGSPQYNARLEQITEQFVGAGANPMQLPNKSALSALLTNEKLAESLDWEMRAFKPVESGRNLGMLAMVPLKQVPADIFNGSREIVDYINNNEADILARDYAVPEFLSDGTAFLAGAVTMRPTTTWKGLNRNSFNSLEARSIFSINSCNGCHSGDTGTMFTHIRPAMFGVEPPLSGFLTGIDVTDPFDRVTVRSFNELERRKLEVETILSTVCET